MEVSWSRDYHWYSRVRVLRPLGRVSGIRTSPGLPSRTMALCSLVIRSWSLSAVKVRSVEAVLANHAPPSDDDVDELPNTVVIL